MTTTTRKRIDIIVWIIAIAGVIAVALQGQSAPSVRTYGDPHDARIPAHVATLPACAEEDSQGPCHWDDPQGGRSFTALPSGHGDGAILVFDNGDRSEMIVDGERLDVGDFGDPDSLAGCETVTIEDGRSFCDG